MAAIEGHSTSYTSLRRATIKRLDLPIRLEALRPSPFSPALLSESRQLRQDAEQTVNVREHISE
jgi:hypothetical protein